MSNNFRNNDLLQRLERNPLRAAVAGAFDISDSFTKDMELLGANRKFSPEGKRDETQRLLRAAVRDLRDLKRPLEEFRKQTETMRARIKAASYDKADLVGAMNRRELRDASRGLNFSQRAALMSGPTRDTNFIDAVLEQPAWISGIDVFNPNELSVYEAAKQERLRDLHGPLMDAITEREGAEQEALMIVNVARGDLQRDSGLESKDFEAVVKPVETRKTRRG